MAMICRRRAIGSASTCVASSASGRGSGAVASAKWAITAASIGSVPRLRGDKLGPNAERPGESPDLGRIDNDDRQSGRAKRCRYDSSKPPVASRAISLTSCPLSWAMRSAIAKLRKGRAADNPSAERTYDALRKYTRDLTEEARQNKLDPVIERDEEIRRTSC
jgi:hypothetical protein